MKNIIEMNHIHKYYRINKEQRFHALDDVNLQIREGEMVALKGRSGAGKTTLLNILGCIDRPDEGEYILNGKPVCGMGHKELGENEYAKLRNQEIGFVMQDFMLLRDKSALFNVMLPFYFSKTPYKEMVELANAALARCGVADQRAKKVSQLSGGQRQRVAIARAIVTEPSVILADEPTGALDSVTTEEILALLTEIHQTGRTILIATHDEQVMAHCQRILTIADGKLQTDV